MPATISTLVFDWIQFWEIFKNYTAWDLEWFDGSSWVSVKEDLSIVRSFPEENHCKFKLIFNASHSGNYRLTFAIDKVAREYVKRADKFQYELTYDDVIITFDWSDCAGISGLVFTHGVKDDYFWFRIRRDNVPLGAHVEIDPSTVATSIDAYACSYSYQRKGFHAAGRFWAWYVGNGNAYYESTTDPNDWTGTATSIGACTTGLDFSVSFDGTYVQYVRYATNDLFYRRGIPQSDGTITWSQAEQLVYDGSANVYHNNPCITVDSNGYAWIGTRLRNVNVYTPYVLKNANNNGTWSTEFAYELNSTSDTSWRVQPVALTNGKVYVIYCYTSALPRGKLYNGGWGSEETDLADYNIQVGYLFCAVNEGDDVHFTYNRQTTYQIRYNKRTYGVGWGANDVLVQDSMENYSAPALSIDTVSGDLYCFWIKITTMHVYYKKCVSGIWDTDPTDWIDEFTDKFNYGFLLNCYAQTYGGYIGLLYLTKLASPYNVRFAYLTILEVTTKGFSDVGGGSDAFINPYRAMPFSDAGHGAEVFNTPFRAMGFADVGAGIDVFALLRELAFSDVGTGSDAFLKEILGAIEKAFSDTGYGTDAFTIPFKAMGFSDSGQGVDIFVIPFKALGFSDVGHGTDAFIVLLSKAFSDTGLGSDAFTKDIITAILKAFADSGYGSDVFVVTVLPAVVEGDSWLGPPVPRPTFPIHLMILIRDYLETEQEVNADG